MAEGKEEMLEKKLEMEGKKWRAGDEINDGKKEKIQNKERMKGACKEGRGTELG